ILPLFLHSPGPPPTHHSFPTRRSSDLDETTIDPHPGVPIDRAKAKIRLLPPDDIRANRRRRGRGILRTWQASRVTRPARGVFFRSEEHTSELQSRSDLVCRLLLEKKKK